MADNNGDTPKKLGKLSIRLPQSNAFTRSLSARLAPPSATPSASTSTRTSMESSYDEQHQQQQQQMTPTQQQQSGSGNLLRAFSKVVNVSRLTRFSDGIVHHRFTGHHVEDSEDEDKAPLTMENFAPLSGKAAEDEELMNALDPQYRTEDFDPTRFLLANLPADVDEKMLDSMIRTQIRTMDVVDSRLSLMIMDNYHKFVQGMGHVQEFGTDLLLATVLVKNGRRHLENARNHLTVSGLNILAKAQRRDRLTAVADDLLVVQSIMQRQQQIDDAVAAGSFPEAIALIRACQHDLTEYRTLHCLQDVDMKLQRRVEVVEDSLRAACLDVCRSFDGRLYEKIFNSFKLLDATAKISSTIESHFSYLVDNLSHEQVAGFAVKFISKDLTTRKLSMMPFAELVHVINIDTDYIPCLRRLLQTYCELMVNHDRILKWHEERLSVEAYAEHARVFKDIQAKLNKGRRPVWEQIQHKTNQYLAGKQLFDMKLDNFLMLLNLINRLIGIGDEFSGGASTELRKAVATYSVAFFTATHRNRTESLKAVLENDVWFACPVKAGFSISDLKEFDFSENVPLTSTRSSNFFATYRPEMRPFEEQASVAAASAPDRDDSKKDLIDNVAKTANQTHGPLLSSSTVSFTKMLGKYISMAEVLTPISYDVIVGFTYLIEFYTYAIFKLFCPDVQPPAAVINKLESTKHNPFSSSGSTTNSAAQTLVHAINLGRIDSPVANNTAAGSTSSSAASSRAYDPLSPDDPFLPPRLRKTLQLLRDRFEGAPTADKSHAHDAFAEVLAANAPAAIASVQYSLPKLHNQVDLKSPLTLYGLSARVVAAESLHFLEQSLLTVRSKLEQMLETRRSFLVSFYENVVAVLPELRLFIYRSVARRFVSFDMTLAKMTQVNWERKDIPTTASDYVGILTRQFQQLKGRFSDPALLAVIPKPVESLLWEFTIGHSIEMLIEGFCRIKKCTPEGRAQMQIDFKTITMTLESVCDLRPLPNFQLMDNYIKSYYFLTETDGEKWIAEHRHLFNYRQMTSIVMLSQAKKTRQKLMMAIDELYDVHS